MERVGILRNILFMEITVMTTEKIYRDYYESEIGLIEVTASESALKTLYFVAERDEDTESNEILADTLQQLDEYFKGERRKFTIPLDPDGTDFQKLVWEELRKIPYGKTVSYLDIAKKLNNVGAIRAVGSANGRNRISIILPCHRVIGSDGKLTGYAGGIWRKEWLLEHEGGNNPDEEQMALFGSAKV